MAADAGARERFDTRVFARVPEPGYPALSLVAPDRTVYVGTFKNANEEDTGPSKVFAYSPEGKLERTYVVKGQTPGQAHGVQVAAISRTGILYLLDQNPPRVIALNPGNGVQATWAHFRDVLPCAPGTQPSGCSDTAPVDNPPFPNYAAWGPDGSMYVTDYEQGVIWRVPNEGARAQVWFTDQRLLGGTFGPAGIVLMPDRRTLMISTSAGATAAPDATTGELYKLPIRADGRPGELEEIWESGPAEAPDGFALAKSGNVYMALVGPTTNQIVVISPKGEELDRFPDDNSGENGSPVPFDMPSSVQFDGRRLIVTNDALVSGDPEHWVLFDIWAGEPGQPIFIPGPKPRRRYGMKVKPRSVTAGVERTFRFHAWRGRRRLAGALVRFAGRRVRTDERGNAKFRLRFANPGVHRGRLRVGKPAKTVATARVRVKPAPSR